MASLANLNSRIDAIIEMFRNDSIPCGNGFLNSVTDTNNENTRILIYPNPATDLLYVNHPDTFTGQYRIFNLQGKILSESTLPGNNLPINISELAPGFYILQTGKYTARFVKM
jgi:hypothetical protein